MSESQELELISKMAMDLIKSDPNKNESIDYRIAELIVARSLLEAEQARKIMIAVLSRGLR